MKHLTFWFDVVSPYACLAFEQLPEALVGVSCEVTYRPVLFAAMLGRHQLEGSLVGLVLQRGAGDLVDDLPDRRIIGLGQVAHHHGLGNVRAVAFLDGAHDLAAHHVLISCQCYTLWSIF